MSKNSNFHLKTVLVALDILEYMAEYQEPIRLTDVSNGLGIPKGRTHRILTTLAHRHYVWQDPESKRYTLGLRSWLLGHAAPMIRSIVDVARSELEVLGDQTQETIVFVTLDDNELVNLYTKASSHPVHAFIREGSKSPIHATSTGKAILADLSESRIDALTAAGLERFTPNTIVDPECLRQEIDKVRASGYAVARDEWSLGLSAVSASIVDRKHERNFSVAVAFPTSRATDERIDEFARLVQATAKRIGQKITA